METNGSHVEPCTCDPLSCPCRRCGTSRAEDAKLRRLADLLERLEKAGISVDDLSELVLIGRKSQLEKIVTKIIRQEIDKVLPPMVKEEVQAIIRKRPSIESIFQRLLRKSLGGK